MGRKKSTNEKGDEPETPLDPEEEARIRDRVRRKINTHFKFWVVCPTTRCRRARRCEGNDPYRCFSRFWGYVPEEHKMMYRAGVTGHGKGLRGDALIRFIYAEMARWRAIDAEAARWREMNARPLVDHAASAHGPAPLADNAPPATDASSAPRVRGVRAAAEGPRAQRTTITLAPTRTRP
jgi:hypothetical protein